MQIFGKTFTIIPSPGSENTSIITRSDKYGDLGVVPYLDAQEAAADEGSLYIARAAPAIGGTGVPMGVQQTFSDTANIVVCLQNNGATKTIIPQYIKGRVTAIGTSNITASDAAIEVDSTNRYSSGGSSLTGLPTNPSTSSPATSGVVHVGAITAAAAGAGRNWIFQKQIRKAAAPSFIVDDEFYFVFGGFGNGTNYAKFANPLDTTADPGTSFIFPVISCALPPTATMLLHIANANSATSAPSFEWEVAWIER